MRRKGHTRPFRDRNGEVLEGSVAETRYLRLGGVDQWVMIRGERIGNPLLVLLHGGPGMSEMLFMRRFNSALERDFTVVYWDQRGAGKSFRRSIPRESMTVEQFLGDLDELIDYVRARFHQKKVVLFGHSWGTTLGTLYAARFPRKVALYVGSAQVGDSAAGEARSYAFAMGEAERQRNRKALRKLREIGPPPHTAKQLMAERTWIQRLTGELTLRKIWKFFRAGTRGPEGSLLDLFGSMRGFRFSLDALWAEASKVNLVSRVRSLRMPVFVMIGRRDQWIPPEASLAFFDSVSAPRKELVWFDHSGHEMFMDEAARFNAVMSQQVRPAVKGVHA